MLLTNKNALIAGALAAIGASVCCVGPLVLLLLGIGGAWIGHLTALEPYRPIFIGLTLLFLGLAFHRLYLVSRVCVPGTPRFIDCAAIRPAVLLKRRISCAAP